MIENAKAEKIMFLDHVTANGYMTVLLITVTYYYYPFGEVEAINQATNENDKDIPLGGNCLKAKLVTPLSLKDQKLCDGPIAVVECLNTVKDFKKCKTPGTDGFSV